MNLLYTSNKYLINIARISFRIKNVTEKRVMFLNMELSERKNRLTKRKTSESEQTTEEAYR